MRILQFSVYGLLFTVLSFPCRADLLAESQARIGLVTGDVGFLSQGASEWITPQEGLPIEPGDQIRTAEDGRVELLLARHMLVLLNPDSRVETESITDAGGRVHLVEGVLQGKLDSAKAPGAQRWDFTTPMAICGVRGTEFTLSFTRKEGARLGVFEGEIDLQQAEGPDGLEPSTRIRTGEEAQIEPGKRLRRLERFDPEMQRLYNVRYDLTRRQTRALHTWTPWTAPVRLEHRRRYVVPPKKAKPRPPVRPRRRTTRNVP